MKKVLILSTLLFLSLQMKAQKNQWELGIEGGPNCDLLFSLVEQNPIPDFNYICAITTEYKIDSIFSIKTGLSFEKMNFSGFGGYEVPPVLDQPTWNSFSYPVGIDLNYLVVPVLTKFEWGDNAKFFVNGGPYFAYLAEAHYLVADPVGSGGMHYFNSRISNFKPYDMGASAGFGFDIPLLKKLILDWELRFNFGLTRIIYPADNAPYNNQSANFILGLKYALIK